MMAYVYGHGENKYRSHDSKLVMMFIVHLLIVNLLLYFICTIHTLLSSCFFVCAVNLSLTLVDDNKEMKHYSSSSELAFMHHNPTMATIWHLSNMELFVSLYIRTVDRRLWGLLWDYHLMPSPEEIGDMSLSAKSKMNTIWSPINMPNIVIVYIYILGKLFWCLLLWGLRKWFSHYFFFNFSFLPIYNMPSTYCQMSQVGVIINIPIQPYMYMW